MSESGFGEWKGVVLPGNPRVDKIAALVLLIEYVTGLLEWPTRFVVEYWRKNTEPAEEEKADWKRRRLYPVDVGRNKYHDRKMGSATEVVAHDLGLDLSRDKVAAGLVETANVNNLTGYLKGRCGGYNVPWVLVEIYKATMFTKPEITVEATAHVIFTELKFRRLKAARAETVREFVQMKDFPELMDLRKQIPFSDDPLTFPQYLYEMFVLGEDVDEIGRRINFWLRNHQKAVRLNRQAVKEAPQKIVDEFRVCGQRCVHIKTDNDRYARALFSRNDAPAMVFRERSSGAFAILSNRRITENSAFQASLRELYSAIVAEEERIGGHGNWFLDDRIWAVMNGSRSLEDSVPSDLAASAVIRLMKQVVKISSSEPEVRTVPAPVATATVAEISGGIEEAPDEVLPPVEQPVGGDATVRIAAVGASAREAAASFASAIVQPATVDGEN